jgi:ribosomal protein L16 Arg81 hydroxylase
VSQIPPVADLLDTPLLCPPYLLVMSDGKPIPQERYCRTERVISSSGVEQFIDTDLVAAELKAGAGIKFNRMELWNRQISSIARELGQARKMAVKVWGFLSPPGERMFASHRDPAHVIALQLDGTKEWRLDGPCPDEPWDSLANVTPSTGSTKLTLEPGDIL